MDLLIWAAIYGVIAVEAIGIVALAYFIYKIAKLLAP